MFNNFPFQVFAWAASLFYAFEVVSTKLLGKYEVKNPWLLNFLYSALVLAFTIPLALRFHAGWPVNWGIVIWTGVFWALGNLCYILALFRLDVSILSPLFNLRIAFTVILGMMLLGERLSGMQLLFLAMIFLGGLLVTLDEKMSYRVFYNWKTSAILLAMLLSYTLEAVLVKPAIAANGYWTVTVWSAAVAQLCFCLTFPKFKNDLKLVGSKQGWMILLIAIFDFFGTLALNKAYEQNVSISSAIVNLPVSAVLAFLVSLAAPKLLEKHSTKVYIARFVGMALIVWAGIKLS